MNEDFIAAVLESIKKRPANKADIRKRFRVGKRASARVAEILEARGLVVCVLESAVRQWVYATPQDAKIITAMRNKRREMARENARLKEAAYKLKCRVEDVKRMEDESIDSWPIKRVFTSAAEVQIVKRGPASVWELAA